MWLAPWVPYRHVHYIRTALLTNSHIPFIPQLLRAYYWRRRVDCRGLYQFHELLAKAARVLNVASHANNEHTRFRQAGIKESHVVSFYHLNEPPRGNVAHLDESGREQ